MFSKSALFAVVCGTLAFGCAHEMSETDEIVDNLVQAGFPSDDIMIVDGKVYVGRDAEVNLAASREMLQTPDGAPEQYRTTNLVRASTVSTGMRKICINGSAFTGVFSDALDRAIANYDARVLTFAMERTPGATGCSFIINGVMAPGVVGGSSGFPSGGAPFGTINIGDGLASFDVNTIEHVITHEIGHTIGFRHSDYFDRSLSCNGLPVNEESPPSGLGAILIPGTPSGAVVGGSIMNSCFRPVETGEFTGTDLTALNRLYGAQVARHGVPAANYQAVFDSITAEGFRPVWVDGYEVAGATFFNAVFAPNTGGAWVARHNMTAAGYQAEFETGSASRGCGSPRSTAIWSAARSATRRSSTRRRARRGSPITAPARPRTRRTSTRSWRRATDRSISPRWSPAAPGRSRRSMTRPPWARSSRSRA
jgi:hypothetical protein